MKKDAVRQANFRKRHLHDEEASRARINMLVDFHAKLRLDRMATHHGMSRIKMLEKVLMDAERELLRHLSSEAVDAYYDAVDTGHSSSKSMQSQQGDQW